MNVVKLLVNLFRFNRTNWKAVSLCVLAAAVFWLFNAFNKNYSTNIRFPLRVEYNEEKFVTLQHLPTEVRLNVNGNGWDLFRKTLGIRLPELTINIERPLELKRIPGSILPALLATQLNGLTINHVVTDTLRFHFDEWDTHKFRLVPDVSNVWFREGFGRTSPVVVLPDSVKLEGPRSVLHGMPGSITVKVPQLTLDESYRGEIKITVTDSLPVKTDPDFVTVMFEAGPVEKVVMRLPIQLLNKPAKIKSVQMDSARVVVQVAAGSHAKQKEELQNILVQLDLKNRDQGTYRLKPVVTLLPVGVELLAIDSVDVRF